MTGENQTKPKNIAILILVAALGYFVDIYDLILFNIIKKESLDALNIDFNTYETVLFRWQMAGMLIGGILWGVWGDKKGRVSVLFGSILIYSVANIANAFVVSLEAYKMWRFIAGLGLAGELGAAITLVSELMPAKKTRHWNNDYCNLWGIGSSCRFHRFKSRRSHWPFYFENHQYTHSKLASGLYSWWLFGSVTSFIASKHI